MAISVGNATAAIKNKAEDYGKRFLKNPIIASVIVGIFIIIVVMWLFRHDRIKHRRTKVLKLLLYSLMFVTTSFFVQNTYLLRNNTITNTPHTEGAYDGLVIGNDPFHVDVPARLGDNYLAGSFGDVSTSQPSLSGGPQPNFNL